MEEKILLKFKATKDAYKYEYILALLLNLACLVFFILCITGVLGGFLRSPVFDTVCIVLFSCSIIFDLFTLQGPYIKVLNGKVYYRNGKRKSTEINGPADKLIITYHEVLNNPKPKFGTVSYATLSYEGEPERGQIEIYDEGFEGFNEALNNIKNN